MKRLRSLYRILAVLETFSLALPRPVWALRPMGGQGTDVEELQGRFLDSGAVRSGAEEEAVVLEKRGEFWVQVPVSMKPAEALMRQKELRARAKEIAFRVGARLANSKLFLSPSRLRADGDSPLGFGLVIGSREDLGLAHSLRDRNQINLLRVRTLDLYHVLENAVDAIADRAEEEGRVYPGRIEVVARQEGEDLVLEVSDNGIGIPEVLKSWIFKERFTTKEEGTRAGGRGAAMLGMYGFRLLKNFDGRLELETLRYSSPGTAEEDREQPWGLAYDPAKDQFSDPERSPGNRTEAGTTVRWRLAGVFREEPRKALSAASVAAGAEEFKIREFDGKLVVTPVEARVPALSLLAAHADIAVDLAAKVPESLKVQYLMHPSAVGKITVEQAKQFAVSSIRKTVSETGKVPAVVLNQRYVRAGEELDWIPPELHGKAVVLNLPEGLVQDPSFTAERLAMLHAIAQRVGGVLAVSRVNFEGNFEGEQAIIVYL